MEESPLFVVAVAIGGLLVLCLSGAIAFGKALAHWFCPPRAASIVAKAALDAGPWLDTQERRRL